MSACRRDLALFLLINTIVFPCSGWAGQGLERFEYSEIVMGVEARIVLYCPDETAGRRAARGAFDRLAELDGVMSDYRPDSELARVCRRAGPGRGAVPISDDLGRVLEQARAVSAASAGAFDVTVGPLAELWRAARRAGELPDPGAVDAARTRVGWRSVLVNTQSRTLELTRPDMQLDLGGIGKGFAAGEAVAFLSRCGVSQCLVDVGGDIAAGNPPPGTDGWQVAIASKPRHTLTIARKAVAMSGDTEQFIEVDGVRYSHIIDPRSGRGLTNRTAVTVIGPDAAIADALASAISVLGADEGLALLDQFPGTSAFVETDIGGDVRRVSSDLFPLAAAALGAAGTVDDRLDWWREARFGMFIHWGLYAIPAGRWNGKAVPGVGEWIMYHGRIPPAEYEPLRERFNPVRFDAGQWARLARAAGMKYIVITTKHHDGFCLFESAHTDYDVTASPFGRDIMKELTDACRREGIRIGWYHSILDWHHPDYLPRRPWDKWESTWTHEHGQDLYDFVRDLRPEIIVNNRVDKGRAGMEGLSKAGEFTGDFGTPEQQVPATGLPGVDWETCMTMNDSWGFKADDHNWKSADQLIRMLADIASKGGNFLLNVGPTALGEIPEPSVKRLEAIGTWMRVNGESIYGTSASPFRRLPWGRCTTRPGTGETTVLYLHVFDWPTDGRLVVPRLKNQPRRAWLLSDKRPLKVARSGDDIVINVPRQAAHTADTVVAVEIQGPPDVEPYVIREDVGGAVTLAAIDATVHGHSARYESGGGKDNIGYWTDPQDTVSWSFELQQPGRFRVSVSYACAPGNGGGVFRLVSGPYDLRGRIEQTGSWTDFRTMELGLIHFEKAGAQEIRVEPVRLGGSALMNLRQVTLQRVDDQGRPLSGRKVLLIGIDGFRPDVLPIARTPNLDRLIADGCYTDQATTTEVTVSGPAWSSFLTGVWPDKHGVHDNTFEGADYVTYPHFFARLKEARPDAFTVSALDWIPLDQHIVATAGTDVRFVWDYEDGGDEKVVAAAVEALTDHDPDIVFVYFADLDVAGHEHGYHPGAPGYVAELQEIDGQVGHLIDAVHRRPTFADEDWLILVGSDHGGTIDGSHGRDIPLHRNVPLIVSGPAAARGRLHTTANVVDLSVTALAHLGVEVDPAWGLDGRPVGLGSSTRFGANLIFNGDAEYAGGYDDAARNAGIAGWTDTGAMTVIRYGAPEGFPGIDAPGPAQRGRCFFCGGKANVSAVHQVIDVADIADEIDTGRVVYALTGWFGGYSDQRDLASLTVRFLDERGAELQAATIGHVTVEDRRAAFGGEADQLTGLLPKATGGRLPVGTRRISVHLLAEAGTGDNDGYADNLSLVLQHRR